MAFLSVTPGSLSVTNEIRKRDFTYVRTYVRTHVKKRTYELAEIWTRISCLALMRSATMPTVTILFFSQDENQYHVVFLNCFFRNARKLICAVSIIIIIIVHSIYSFMHEEPHSTVI